MFDNYNQFIQFSKNVLHAIKHPTKNKSPIKSFNTLAATMAECLPEKSLNIHQLKSQLDNQANNIESLLKQEFQNQSREILLSFMKSLPESDKENLINGFWECHAGRVGSVFDHILDENEEVLIQHLDKKIIINKKILSILLSNLPDSHLNYAHEAGNIHRSDDAYQFGYYDFLRDAFWSILEDCYKDFQLVVEYSDRKTIESETISEITKKINKYTF